MQMPPDDGNEKVDANGQYGSDLVQIRNSDAISSIHLSIRPVVSSKEKAPRYVYVYVYRNSRVVEEVKRI